MPYSDADRLRDHLSSLPGGTMGFGGIIQAEEARGRQRALDDVATAVESLRRMDESAPPVSKPTTRRKTTPAAPSNG